MGAFQSSNNTNNNNVKKTDEQIREDMRRKWENFGASQSSKVNQEEENGINKEESDINNISPTQHIEEKKEEENEINKEESDINNASPPQKIEEKKEEENNEHKHIFLTLKRRPEEIKENDEKYENKEQSNNNEEKINNINKDSDINKNINIELNEIVESTDNKEEAKNDEIPEENKITDNEEINQNNVIKQNNNEESPQTEKNNEKQKDEKQDEEAPKPVKKNIDLENKTIEKVFRITLSEENPKQYLFLELFLAKLLSIGQNPSFKLENLDDIILTVINEPSIKSNLLNYLLECFHRAYEIIENRYKDTLDPKFAEIHLSIATYFGQVVSSPESFDLSITKKQISEIIKNYYLKTSEEEFLCLFKDITINCGDDVDSLSLVLHYLFEIMHMENLDKQTFFKGKEIKKNLNLLLKILQEYPKVRKVFLNDVLYNPQNINGRLIQALSFYGPYLSDSPLNAPPEQTRSAFKQFTNDSELKSYINKLNNIIETLVEVLKILEECDDEKSINYFYSVINKNLDWQKTIKNFMNLSSISFLLNILYLCLTLFFYECHKYKSEDSNSKNKEYKIKSIKHINTKFCLNDKNILFSKFNVIYSMICKDYIEANKVKSESVKYNLITKLFFICHSLMGYILPTLMKLYMDAGKAASTAFSTLGFNNPKTKESIITLKLYDIYVKNDKFVKSILEFNEITSFFLITLNNSKYAHNDELTNGEQKETNTIKEEEDEYTVFKSDYYEYMDDKSNVVISSLPEYLLLNMVNSCVFFRQAYTDLYFRDSELVKNLVIFGLIYSSHINIIHNQHLRSQIFDILLYSFHLEEKEKNDNRLFMVHQKLLKDEFIKENLILSIMRVFIDAERLGTSNQFYERFNVRNKVLQFVNEVFKKNQEILIDDIINYANHHSDDATQMLTLLMGDVTYLIDEVIQRLIDIRNYQELKDNSELWNAKTTEQKTQEDNKFAENDRMLKAECRLLNHSLGFMTIICSCLQKYFIKEEKAERLANLLNYCLDEFTAKSSQLKIKNKKDYEFKPSYIMESIIKIFSYFVDYEEFIEFVVSDERSYKYENFTKAIKLKNDLNKVKVDMETSEKFDNLVYNKLNKAKELVEQKTINYDDAPEEFIDPLTYNLMENPVILPSSHINIDRRTIEEYLLANPTDPFNRNPLTKEELIPNDELKKKIDDYKMQKFKEKQKNYKNNLNKNETNKDNTNQETKDNITDENKRENNTDKGDEEKTDGK